MLHIIYALLCVVTENTANVKKMKEELAKCKDFYIIYYGSAKKSLFLNFMFKEDFIDLDPLILWDNVKIQQPLKRKMSTWLINYLQPHQRQHYWRGFFLVLI